MTAHALFSAPNSTEALCAVIDRAYNYSVAFGGTYGSVFSASSELGVTFIHGDADATRFYPWRRTPIQTLVEERIWTIDSHLECRYQRS
jgi:hypothetical protein